MPRAKTRRECLAHRWDCKRGGGSDYVSARCAPVPKGDRGVVASVEFRAVFAHCTPAKLAARDAEHAAYLATMTPEQRCAYRDGIPTPEEQLAAIRVTSQRIRAELSEIG